MVVAQVRATALPHTPPLTERKKEHRPIVYLGRVWKYIKSPWTLLQRIFYQIIATLIDFLKSFQCDLKKTKELRDRFGYGIQNCGNSCYINAVIQALRFTPLLRTGFNDIRCAKDPKVKELSELFFSLETTYKRQGRTLSAYEMSRFREKMIDRGFETTSSRSQEDASQFCQFLLDQIGFQLIHHNAEVFHEMRFTVPSLDRGKPLENHIQLAFGKAKPGCELKDLALCNVVIEEVDTACIRTQTEYNQEPDCQSALQKMDPLTMIPTLQSIQLEEGEGKIPQILPIFVKRFEFDPKTGQRNKITASVIPSPTIDFPLSNHPTKKAHFVLCSIVVHSGTTLEQGHYSTYVPIKIDSQEALLEYDDSTVSLHLFSGEAERKGNKLLETIAENGYLFFYKHVATEQ